MLEIKKGLKKNKKEFVFLIVVLILVVLGLFLKNQSDEHLLKHPKFTIGVISSEWHSKGTFKPPGKDIKYFVNNKEYESVVSVSKNTYNKGDRFLIVYDSIKPSKAIRFFGQYPIPVSVKNPKNGWRLDEIPIEFDLEDIENILKNK